MKILKSETLGYCRGVAETVAKAEDCIRKSKETGKFCYSIGDLIHNPDVVSAFRKNGLKVIENPECEPGIALVRAHGIPDKLRADFEKSGFELIDATCVNIRKTKETIKTATKSNRTVVVFGVPNHAETLCLLGTDGAECFLVSDAQSLENLFDVVPSKTPITVVTQTTFPFACWKELSEKIKMHYEDVQIGSTLCGECIKRRNNAVQLAEKCDAVIVIGGKKSKNTEDLANSVVESGRPVFQIENVSDFTPDLVQALCCFEKIGICSGTSTPIDVIDDVCKRLESLERNT